VVVAATAAALAIVRRAGAEESPAAERRAAAALEEARKGVAGGRMKAAWEKLAALQRDYAKTRVFGGAREEIARLRLAAGIEVVGAAAGFRAVVEPGGGKGALRIVYDFADLAALEDFEPVFNLPDVHLVRRTIEFVSGTGAWCHRAVFQGDVRFEIEGEVLDPHDVGLVCVDPDAQDPRFLVGVLGNSYFGVKYDEERSISPGHILLFAGRGAESRARSNPSQIFARVTEPPLVAGQVVRMALSWKGTALRLGLLPTSLDLPGALTNKNQEMPRKRIGVHLWRSKLRPRRAVLEGVLDPDWSKAELERLRSRLAGAGR
jgi:hypothetical protein